MSVSFWTCLTHLALQVVLLLYGLSGSCVIHLQYVIPVLKLGFKHLQSRSSDSTILLLKYRLHQVAKQDKSSSFSPASSPDTRCPPGCGWRRHAWAGAAWSRFPVPVLMRLLGPAAETSFRSRWRRQTSSPGCRRTWCPEGTAAEERHRNVWINAVGKWSYGVWRSWDGRWIYQSQLWEGVQFDLVIFVLNRQFIVDLWQLQIAQT